MLQMIAAGICSVPDMGQTMAESDAGGQDNCSMGQRMTQVKVTAI